jgi:hypothetical protein
MLNCKKKNEKLCRNCEIVYSDTGLFLSILFTIKYFGFVHFIHILLRYKISFVHFTLSMLQIYTVNILDLHYSFSPSSSQAKIKQAHKRIMLLNHPDRGKQM